MSPQYSWRRRRLYQSTHSAVASSSSSMVRATWIQERLVLALSGAWLNPLRIIGACNVSPRGWLARVADSNPAGGTVSVQLRGYF